QSELLRYRKEKLSAISKAKLRSKVQIEEAKKELEEIRAKQQELLQQLKQKLIQTVEKDENNRINLLKEIWLERKDEILNHALQLILPTRIGEEL
ncbi:MAG: hypothetical protein ACTSR2_11400, partial [Candidatus Hodarchaeales archaeon]